MTEQGMPTLRVDFQNCDPSGRVRLNTRGTLEDLASQRVQLAEGQALRLVDGELAALGSATFSADERLWVATVDWKEVIPSN